MSSYTLNIVNESQQPGTVVLFQELPGSSPLAWQTRPAPPQAPTTIQWEDQVSFVWGQTGNLSAGVIFRAAQSVAANPSGANQVPFTEQNGVFMFGNPTSGPGGTYTVMESSDIQPGAPAAVGVGLSGPPLAVQMARPGFQAQFPVQSTYQLALMPSVQQGQVLDPGSVPNQARVSFPQGVTSMKATYNANGMWSVTPA